MGTHINSKGQFQSDKNPGLKPNHIILDFEDPAARDGLWLFSIKTPDKKLGEDVRIVINGFEK